MCAREAQALAVACDLAEYPCAFVELETAVAEECEGHVVVGDGWGVYDQGVCGVAESLGHGIHAVGITDGCAFGSEFVGECALCAVVAGNVEPFRHIVTGQRGHADAADTHEIYSFHF